MHFLQKVQAADVKLEDVVAKMMADPNFLRALPDMIIAAKAAIVVGQKQDKPDMVKFNSLALAYLTAIQEKDAGLANQAATALVAAGHGAAFGLKKD